jgi:uncharacterized OsmC-like protein
MEEQKTINLVNGIEIDTLQNVVKDIQEEPELGKCRFHVTNKWLGANHNCTTVSSFYGAKQEIEHNQPFELHADEPAILAGQDKGANPVEYLLHALASCVTTSLVAHAAVRGISLEEVESEIEGDINIQGYLGLSKEVPKGFTDIRMKLKVKSGEENTDKLKALAEFSPVYNTLIHCANVDIKIESK